MSQILGNLCMGHEGCRVGWSVILTDAEVLTTLDLSLEFRSDQVSKGTGLWQNIWCTCIGLMEWPLIESPPWNLVNYLDRTVKDAFSLTVSGLLLFLLTLSTIHGRCIPVNEWVGTSPMRCQYIIFGVVIGQICSDGIICIIAESKALKVGNPGKVSFDASLQYFYVNYCVSCCSCYCFKKV